MRLRSRRAPVLLLLIPSLAAALTSPAIEPKEHHARAVAAAPAAAATEAEVPTVIKTRFDVGTKDAPVDGKDGRPHQGPFVDTDRKKESGDADTKKELPKLKGRPEDPTIIDGKKIPETNDGVMDDRTRQKPKEGTTGTEGGVSEKDKARKAQEGKTGEKAETKPAPPKEAPPLPHSEQEKILSEKEKNKEKDTKSAEDVAGLEKPADLPDKLHGNPNPIPDSANKDHLDVSKSKSKGTITGDEDVDGIIRPFHSFMLSLTMILVSEVGDKTFLVAALMAMKHDRMVVFSAAFGALLVMTVLSAILGHALPTLIPKRLTSFLAAGLFLVFGFKLLREAEKEKEQGRHRGSSISPYALEMGLNGRKSRSKSRFPSPPRSPSMSPTRSPSPSNSFSGAIAGLNNLFSLLLSPAWVQTFVMTFLGEWGDRSQIATIAMAAGQDYWWVTLGAMLGHCICTGVAVIGGRAIAGRVSMKVVTVGGAIAFLAFGLIYFVEAFYA